MFGASEPVTEHFEKSLLLHLGRSLHVFRERPHSLFVRFKKQTVFALKMLEDGTFGDAQFGGDVLDAGGAVAVLGEVTDGYFNDSSAFGLRTRTWFSLRPQLRRLGQAAGYSIHA